MRRKSLRESANERLVSGGWPSKTLSRGAWHLRPQLHTLGTHLYSRIRTPEDGPRTFPYTRITAVKLSRDFCIPLMEANASIYY